MKYFLIPVSRLLLFIIMGGKKIYAQLPSTRVQNQAWRGEKIAACSLFLSDREVRAARGMGEGRICSAAVYF